MPRIPLIEDLTTEAAQHTARFEPELRRLYPRVAARSGHQKAIAIVARRMLVSTAGRFPSAEYTHHQPMKVGQDTFRLFNNFLRPLLPEILPLGDHEFRSVVRLKTARSETTVILSCLRVDPCRRDHVASSNMFVWAMGNSNVPWAKEAAWNLCLVHKD